MVDSAVVVSVINRRLHCQKVERVIPMLNGTKAVCASVKATIGTFKLTL